MEIILSNSQVIAESSYTTGQLWTKMASSPGLVAGEPNLPCTFERNSRFGIKNQTSCLKISHVINSFGDVAEHTYSFINIIPQQNLYRHRCASKVEMGDVSVNSGVVGKQFYNNCPIWKSSIVSGAPIYELYLQNYQ